MSVEARLQALIQNYRAQHGDAALRAAPQLIAQLSSQAPDLYGEIRALAAVIAGNGAARIAAAADQDAEAQRVATEIAGSEKLSMAVATAGVAVARALGPVGGGAQAAPAAPAAPIGGWAGETVVAPGAALPPAPPMAAPPQQQYAPPPGQPQAAGYVPPGTMPPPGQPTSVPLHKNKVVIGAAVAVVLVIGYAVSQRDRPTPAPRPEPQPSSNGQAPAAPGPQAGGPGGSAPQSGGQQGQPGEYPTLAASGSGPALQVNRMQNGYAIPFLIQVDGTPTPGGVIVPLNGWDQGPATIVFGQPGDTRGTGQIVNTGSAQMQRTQGRNGPARMGVVQWQRDQLNIGPICVAFNGNRQSQSGDVGMSGTTMCLMDANCQQDLGCGTIR